MLPGTFIPLAEETACEQLAVWSRQPKMKQVNMAINVSAREFEQTDFVQQV